VVDSIISQYPFSPGNKRELESIEEHLDYLSELRGLLRGSNLATDLHNKLLAAASKNPPTNDSKDMLSLERVAEFLTAVSMSEKAVLAKTVKSGLQSLGIERPKPGRPKGRRTETLYFEYVEALQRAIEQTGVFAKKTEMKRTCGARWQPQLRQFLERGKWPVDSIHLVITSTTTRVLAIHIASQRFGRSYDRIARACRRTTNTVRK
jgi:hypothetical protein